MSWIMFLIKDIRFYQGICANTCAAICAGGTPCGGKPKLRRFSKVSIQNSVFLFQYKLVLQERSGSPWFIGCSQWAPPPSTLYGTTVSNRHYFRAIPNEIKIDILDKLLDRKPLYDFSRRRDFPDIVNDIQPLADARCTNIVHPASVPPSGECGKTLYKHY